MFRNYLLVIALCGATCAVHAQELFALSGALKGKHHSERTFTGQIDYQQRLGESIAFSGGWINEGHLSGHHRDGATAQIWARTDALDRRLTLAAGIGPSSISTRYRRQMPTAPTTTTVSASSRA